MAHRILVVDDDANTARLVKLYLQKDGHMVMVASDGRQALDMARERKPDLIVLDLMLPHVDARGLPPATAGIGCSHHHAYRAYH